MIGARTCRRWLQATAAQLSSAVSPFLPLAGTLGLPSLFALLASTLGRGLGSLTGRGRLF